ncbi:hypothetical protein D3C87_1830060 [compost metagenome]
MVQEEIAEECLNGIEIGGGLFCFPFYGQYSTALSCRQTVGISICFPDKRLVLHANALNIPLGGVAEQQVQTCQCCAARYRIGRKRMAVEERFRPLVGIKCIVYFLGTGR